MYTPPFNAVDDEQQIRAMVAAARTAWFVTADGAGVPSATLVPILWTDETVVAHMARANPQWRGLDGSPALLIVSGPDAYVSPSWYAAKAEHGRVVPTWNYTAVHLVGTARVHEDPSWLRTAVSALTDAHEAPREDRWHLDDAPEAFVEGQLRGIVGIEVTVTSVEAKAKLSQNRSAADRAGVVAGLTAEPYQGAAEVAAAMDS